MHGQKGWGGWQTRLGNKQESVFDRTWSGQVEDLIAAQAAVGRDEKFLELGEADNWSSLSVAEQIFDAVSLRSRYI